MLSEAGSDFIPCTHASRTRSRNAGGDHSAKWIAASVIYDVIRNYPAFHILDAAGGLPIRPKWNHVVSYALIVGAIFLAFKF